MDVRTSDAHGASSKVGQAGVPWARQMALLRRWRMLFAAGFALSFVLIALVILAIPTRYKATAAVMIDPRRERVVELNQVLPDLPIDAAAVDTQVEVLKSRGLAEAVTTRLHLDRDPEFNPELRPKSWLRLRPSTGVGTTVDQVIRRLHVARVGMTYVIDIDATAASPDKAAAIANAVVAAYLQQQLDAKAMAAHRASDWLSARLGGLRTQVEAAEREVERYKAQHGLMTLAEGQGSTVTEQEISTLDAQLAATRGERAEAEARLSAAQTEMAGGGQGDNLGEVLNSPMVQELRKQRDDAAQTIAELQGRYGPRHPELLKAERQREALDAQIKQEIARVVSNLNVQTMVATSRSAAIAAALGSAKAALAKSNSDSVALKELERNLEAVRTLYQSFLDRYRQTSAQDGMAQSDARSVSPARAVAATASPRLSLLAVSDLAISIVLAFLAVWIAEAREDGLYTAEDIETRLALSCESVIPSAKSGRDFSPADLVVQQPLSAYAEAFRTLRTALRSSRNAGPIRVVAVTSALPGEGKSTTCIGLGRMMARGGATVAVDCDLRRRTMSRLLAAPPGAGLLDVLAGRAELEAALIEDGQTGLWLLPLGDEAKVEEEVLETAAMDNVLDALRRRFKTVILDTAPVLMVAETRALACKADAVLFVVRWRKTKAELAIRAARTLREAGAHLTGAVLTQADLRAAGRDEYGYAADYYPFYREETSASEPYDTAALPLPDGSSAD